MDEPTDRDANKVVAAVRAALGAPAPDPADYLWAVDVVRDQLWLWFSRGRESHYKAAQAVELGEKP